MALPVPSLPALAGFALFGQGFVLDAGNLSTTNAVECVFGSR